MSSTIETGSRSPKRRGRKVEVIKREMFLGEDI